MGGGGGYLSSMIPAVMTDFVQGWKEDQRSMVGAGYRRISGINIEVDGSGGEGRQKN